MVKQQQPWFLREEIVSTYESWYEGKGRRADILEKDLLRSLMSDFDSASNLLEVGCGTAHFTRFFESMGIKCLGLDISPLMLKEAKRLWGGHLIMGASHILPFSDKSFDLVALITCMEYMPKPIEVLREAQRISKKGLIWGIMNKWSLPTARRTLQVLLGRNPFYKNAHFFSILEAKKLLSEVYDNERIQIRWKTTVFPRIIPLRHSSIPFGAFLAISVKVT